LEELRAALGRGVRPGELWKDRTLTAAATNYLGGRRAALVALGIHVPPQPRWTPEAIVAALRDRHEQGLLMTKDRALYQAAIRAFGSGRKAREAAGLPPTVRQWTKEQVLEAIQDRYVQGESLSSKRCERGLVTAAKRLFGSWSKAIGAAGLDRDGRGALRRRAKT
jgi:hypothetical protein